MRSGDVVAGRYRLDEVVGVGGMGEVWRATDLELRRVVALKQATTGDGEATRREARIGAGLHHAHVISVFDTVVDGDRRWLVMEYLPARSLAEICRTDGPIAPDLATRVGAQIATALAAMHAKGMVHRDITLANVLVTPDGTAKLADLGVAMWDEVTVTGSAREAGTDGYLAPEVRRGHRATPAADVYSLGVALSAAAEGRVDKRLAGVLAAMTDPDPARRPDAEWAARLFGATRGPSNPVLVTVGAAVALVAVLAATLTASSGPFSSAATRGAPPPGTLLYGIGDLIGTAMESEFVRETPVTMLTTNYHKPSDLPTMTPWRDKEVPDAYARGYALHVLVADWEIDDPEVPVDTKYGPGCGRSYPLSPAFGEHMRALARIFAGKADDPPLYVTVFNEVNKMACEDGSYAASPAYYEALQDSYLDVRRIIKETAPNAQVALGWDGYQVEDDDAESGGGRSMFSHFARALRASDYQAVVAKQRYGNVFQVRESVRILGEYGKVMVAAYLDTTGEVLDLDVRTLLSDESIAGLNKQGLFAWNFNNQRELAVDRGPVLDYIKNAIRRTGRAPR
ncbi:serine/threonine-protein kinase [Saccharothrix variisporea]|uniref:non-specific serine/threonine protein kinase n=1 Tax=Saccharothrix variisporea TaxID=543527 RepID=A0A495X4P2_9PSEU|nr:serine/threonine-protein kinase [Saccharothrix variisporea]RKT69261.1 protein kinase-like protein [Saccharothrix variisporea]